MTLEDILLWAAGADVRLPEFPSIRDERLLYVLGIDEEELLYLVHMHRLELRFFSRLHRERPSWCSENLYFESAIRAELVRERFDYQLAALNEIANSLPDECSPMILLKGFSVFALTAESQHIHFSEDLDILCETPEIVEDAANNLGYDCQRISKFEHEFSYLKRGTTKFEIHRHFPLRAYPDGLNTSEVSSRAGHWFQTVGNYTTTPLEYGTIADQTTDGPQWLHHKVRISLPEICVLVLSANILKDYIAPPYRQPLPVKLSSLAALRDLCRRFDISLYSDPPWMNTFKARDVVRFAAQLLREFFGENTLNEIPEKIRPRKSKTMSARHIDREAIYVPFPRALSFFGGWATFVSAKELLIPLGLQTIIERIGGNDLVIGPATRQVHYSPSGNGGVNKLERILFYSSTGLMPRFSLSAWLDAETIEFQVTIDDVSAPSHLLHVEIRGIGIECSPWATAQGTTFLETDELGHHFNMRIAWDNLPYATRRKSHLPLFVVITQFDESISPYEGANPLVILPIICRLK